jgi:hypothetical protein
MLWWYKFFAANVLLFCYFSTKSLLQDLRRGLFSFDSIEFLLASLRWDLRWGMYPTILLCFISKQMFFFCFNEGNRRHSEGRWFVSNGWCFTKLKLERNTTFFRKSYGYKETQGSSKNPSVGTRISLRKLRWLYMPAHAYRSPFNRQSAGNTTRAHRINW